ncbi:MAG: low molecular weight protein arginine phosphatase [candidate division Zixibacteria bacterium]|nr:low molecular weight protein arginine phosphatase [candidate division Zixibacteria bacterium]
MGNYKVLFICTGNTCRSPMAEGSLRVLLQGRGIDTIDVLSAGTAAPPGCPATTYAVEAVKTWDGDISGHRSRPMTRELIEEADLILVMTPTHYRDVVTISPEAREKTFLLKRFPEPGDDGEGVADPIGGSLDQYNQTFLEIGEELGRMLPELIRRAAVKGERGS